MGVEKRHSHVKFSKTIRLGKNLDLDNAVVGEVEVGSLRDTGVFIQRWNGTSWDIIATRRLDHTEKTGNYTLTSTDQVVIFNLSVAAVATLADPTGNSGKAYAVINKHTSTKNVTFSRSIDGAGSFALLPGENISIMSDGTEYLIYK